MKRTTLLAAGLLAAGVVFSPVLATEWTDPAGDVTLPKADIVSGSATIVNGMIDLRVRFSAEPFAPTSDQTLTWFFDLDHDPNTTNPNFTTRFRGADGYLFVTDDGHTEGIPGVNMCVNGSIDRGTYTLRLLFPQSLLPGVNAFNYAVLSDFSNSGGQHEFAPDTIAFAVTGDYFTSDSDTPPPFQGEPLCHITGIDIKPGGSKNTINDTGGNVKVAILSDATFNALTDLNLLSLSFGRTGYDTGPLSCSSKPTDVNGDGLGDLVCQFYVPATAFQPGDTVGYVTGRTLAGALIYGTDSVDVH